MTTKTKKALVEHPTLTGFRLMKHHKKAVKKLAKNFTRVRKEKISESQVVREAIEAFEYQNT